MVDVITRADIYFCAWQLKTESWLWQFIYLFIYFSTYIDNTSNTNKNNKMPAKDRKAPEGTLTSTLINTV